jgi:adenylate cyclase
VNVLDADLLHHERQSGSVNMTAVPLSSSKGEQIGSMLVFEDITREKRLKGAMSRYMPKEVADRLLEGGENALGGRAPATVSSPTSASSPPSPKLGAKTVAMLNSTSAAWWTSCSNAASSTNASATIMAVFGPFSSGRDETTRGATIE